MGGRLLKTLKCLLLSLLSSRDAPHPITYNYLVLVADTYRRPNNVIFFIKDNNHYDILLKLTKEKELLSCSSDQTPTSQHSICKESK